MSDLEQYMRAFPDHTFIAKPSRGRGGEGIVIVKRLSDLPKSAMSHEFLVQRYLDSPLLIEKKKFDLRLYLTVCGIDPVEAFIFDEGLGRFCTENYRKPEGSSVKNPYVHLTNFSLNKNSRKFIESPDAFLHDFTSSKRLMSNVF